MRILSERSESKDLSSHPAKGVCPERPSGVKELSSNPMRMRILSERSESKDLSSHPLRESVLLALSDFSEGRSTAAKDLASSPGKDFYLEEPATTSSSEEMRAEPASPIALAAGCCEAVEFPRKRYNGWMTDSPKQQMQCMEVWGGSQLTSKGVEMAGLDVWVYSKPFGQAQRGGDVYYVSSCASGRISRLLLADVSGHGNSVASMAADLRTLMRRFVNQLDQNEFVRLLNEQFTAVSRNGTFSTAVVTTFFAPTRRLSLCNAGHPRPLLFRARDGRWSFLGHDDHPEKKGPRNIPLGVLPITEYAQLDIELDPGDCLLSYTDALIESCDADGEMLGEEGLLRIINLLGDVPAEKVIASLLQEIGERFPENLSADDVTLMVVRANGRSLHFSLREKMDAFGQFLKTLFRSLNPRAERAPFPDANLANVGGMVIPALERRWRAPRTPPNDAREETRQ
jgi:sigma-B regulation protein RsbU (phosphoserine phosphatase)